MTSRACCRNTSPGAVSTICRFDRSNSSTPNSFSSLATDADSADCTTWIRWAAREKFSSPATATKYSNCRNSIRAIYRELRSLQSISAVGRDRSLGVVLRAAADDHQFTGGPKMRALRFNQFGGPDVLHVADLPDPHATAKEAVIRVKAASVNPSDVKNVAGQMDWTVLPRTPGRDFAGVVVSGPSEWEGAKVWGTGGDGGV